MCIGWSDWKRLAVCTPRSVTISVSMVRQRDFGDGADRGRRRDRARRVVGRDQHEHARPRRDAGLDLGRVERKVVCLKGRYGHGDAAAQMHRSVIGGEARRGDQHFVARRHQRQHREHDRFLHARRHHDLARAIIQPARCLEVVSDRLPQFGKAGRPRVVMRVGVKRGLGRRDDMVRRMKIRIAPA